MHVILHLLLDLLEGSSAALAVHLDSVERWELVENAEGLDELLSASVPGYK